MKLKSWKGILIGIVVLSLISVWSFKKFNFNRDFTVGQKLDSINGVFVYYNGGVNNVKNRNTTAGGYNLGLKYQCVEFVKRYYYEHFNHKMPDSYGHAKDFFDHSVVDGKKNEKRNLLQYTNPSMAKPNKDDLVIFSGTVFNKYGHVAIISKVTDNVIEIIQQNPGPFSPSRVNYSLRYKDGKWQIENQRILGWLRKDTIE